MAGDGDDDGSVGRLVTVFSPPNRGSGLPLSERISRAPTPSHDSAKTDDIASGVPNCAAMADSDEEYVQDISDDEVEAHQVTRGAGTSSRATGHGTRGSAWEVTRTWENVVEGADGTINSTVEGLREAGKRKR